MSIYSNAVKRPLTTILIFIALVVMGLYSLTRLPVDLYPDMEFPFLTVFTSYPGASAADIETNVTNTLENSLSALSNLKTITSTSSDNSSIMFIEFEWGTNTDEAANEIRDQLDFITRFLPEDCEDPTLLKFNTSMMPILFYSVSAKESYAGIEKILDEKVVNPLNRIEGVGSVGVAGSPGREIYVDVDPIKLEAYNLSVEQIGNVLRMENMNMPAGYLEMGNLDYPLRVQGEFEDSYIIKDLVVGSFNGNSIYLRDVATVTDSKKESKAEERINGDLGVRMYIQKQSGGNTVQVAEEVRAAFEELKKDLPADIKIETIFDSSEFIEGSIGNLTSTLMYAMIFVVLVVLFFLGRWRATFIVIITIPISLIVAFIYLALSGNSINIISLASLSIAIGMVVDDAIVVLENITKHIERGSSPKEAAIYATNEVWMAVIVTTLAIVAVFFPLTFVQGLTGQFFRQLGMIVTLTTITSTVAAITLTPTLSSLMLKLRNKKKKPGKLSYDNTIKKMLNRFDGFYERTLRWSLKHKAIILIASVLIFIGSISLMTQVGAELMPEADQSSMGATVEMQTGTRVRETKALAVKIDNLLMEKYPEIKLISTSTGSDEEANFATMFSSTGTHTIIYTFTLTDLSERERSVWDLAEALRSDLEVFPEIVNFQVTTGEQGMGSMMSSNIAVEVYGYDLVNTNLVAKELAEKIALVPGASDIQVSRDASKPELQIVLDQNKMILHGLNTATVSTVIKNRVDGMIATRLRESGDEYDVIVRYQEDSRNTITDIQSIPIRDMQGQIVRLGEIAEIKEFWSPPNIEHKRKERIVSVTAVPHKRPLGEVGADIQLLIDEMDVPAGVSVEVSGAVEDMMESMADLGLLLVISLLLVYLVMASQFESLKMPFIIMFSIPFAFSGVAIALFLTDTTFSLVAGIGAIMLVGIVVKNAIVLVDYINLMRDRGLELIEAVAVSGRSRIRPVLMTSMTTILAMLPLAMSTGEGSEIWSPMGIAVIGGLVFSTLVTLVLVPVVYVIFSRRGERNKKRGVQDEYAFLEVNNETK